MLLSSLTFYRYGYLEKVCGTGYSVVKVMMCIHVEITLVSVFKIFSESSGRQLQCNNFSFSSVSLMAFSWCIQQKKWFSSASYIYLLNY